MTLLERIRAAQEKDVHEMQGIYAAVASGIDPDVAAAEVVGGEFNLSDHSKEALKG